MPLVEFCDHLPVYVASVHPHPEEDEPQACRWGAALGGQLNGLDSQTGSQVYDFLSFLSMRPTVLGWRPQPSPPRSPSAVRSSVDLVKFRPMQGLSWAASEMS